MQPNRRDPLIFGQVEWSFKPSGQQLKQTQSLSVREDFSTSGFVLQTFYAATSSLPNRSPNMRYKKMNSQPNPPPKHHSHPPPLPSPYNLCLFLTLLIPLPSTIPFPTYPHEFFSSPSTISASLTRLPPKPTSPLPLHQTNILSISTRPFSCRSLSHCPLQALSFPIFD
ncbi:hypothetical protein B9Z19DRAFT_843003 [Tuber borchii]|uniref:Uncharacterized protein n=1 Tax=Tuber borchii TaxID=42251 RepID=A0A2T6ZUQ0_TUBBO|nr:hypothetical protein B9Z19DRAFT_843003 [Tuber borchii]